MRAPFAVKLSVLFAVASILSMSHSQLLAQTDEVPETVPITPSLIRGTARTGIPVYSLPRSERLPQLTGDDLKALLPGSQLSALTLGGQVHLGCDGRFVGRPWNAGSPPSIGYITGRYSIRDNQFCWVHENSSDDHCVEFFRTSGGQLLYLQPGFDVYLSAEITAPGQACHRP